MKKSIPLLLLLLPFLLASCVNTATPPSCRDILTALIDSEVRLPAGSIYSLSTAPGDKEYLSPTLLTALYGNESSEKILEGWLDCALFIPFSAHPCEFAVVYCRDRDTAEDTARLFTARLNHIRNAKSAPEHEQMLESASVTIHKNYVFFIISQNEKEALAIAKDATKGG